MKEIRDGFGKDSGSGDDGSKDAENKEAASKSNLNFFIILGVILILFISVFALTKLVRPKVTTIDQVIANTLEGDENPETNYMYNGFVFVKVGTLWYTRWQSEGAQFSIPLHYGPLEVEDVGAEGRLDDRFNTGKYYITFDPNGEDFSHVALAAGELGRNLVEGLGMTISSACYTNHSVCDGKPIITCENTDEPVIYIKESNNPKIVMDGNCLILQGKGKELVKVVDRAILQMYGIMK